MDAANEQTQGASAEKTGEKRSVVGPSAERLEVEYATIEAAEVAQTLEKDRRMLVFGEDRLLFLADAVFAIAMTLLVLEITLPAGEHITDEGHFNEALVTLIEQTVVFLITFAVLARYWIAHRSLMRLVDRLDTPVIWLTENSPLQVVGLAQRLQPLHGMVKRWYNAGMDTSKPQHRKITIALPQPLIEAMKTQAAAHRRSLTGEITWALQEYLSHQPQAEREQE